MALNPNMGKRAMEETADGEDEHGAQVPDREAKRRCVEGRSTIVPEQGLLTRQPPLKRPRESESVGGRSGGGGDGDGSSKRHNASGKEYAVDTGAEDAANGSDVIECLRGVTNSPVNLPVEDLVERPDSATLDQGGADLGSSTGSGGHGGDGEEQGGEVDTSSSAAEEESVQDDGEGMKQKSLNRGAKPTTRRGPQMNQHERKRLKKRKARHA